MKKIYYVNKTKSSSGQQGYGLFFFFWLIFGTNTKVTPYFEESEQACSIHIEQPKHVNIL